ncbi:RYR1 protein, partial [Motacilla alba]|nr:RYR1 protein [Motacilla alba]
PGTLQELISQTMVHWAQESFIQSPALVRAMFSLLHRQYDALGELGRALPKAYAISATSVPDTTALLECLGQIRSLLIVQMGPEEENLMIQSIGCVRPSGSPCVPPVPPHVPPVSPCVLLVSTLCPLVSSLGHPASPLCPLASPLCPLASPLRPPCVHPGSPCVTLCPLCVFLCRAARCCCTPKPFVSPCPAVSSCVPWCPWVLWCPLVSPGVPDVPRCPLGQVVTYLASCGLQSCPMLLAKGYPDIGWNPCGGEKYLDFLRFAVFVNGESVEENANVVVRLLIR